MELDTYYCLEFLRQEGVCVVPGNGFGQKEGTYHFRYVSPILSPFCDLTTLLKSYMLWCFLNIIVAEFPGSKE